MKHIFDHHENQTNFSMMSLYKQVLRDLDIVALTLPIEKALGKKVSRHVLQGIVRFVFLIELVKETKIDSTKFATRWTNRLSKSDPRYSSYDDCLQIFVTVITNLIDALTEPRNRQLLKLFSEQNLVAYEIPLDYNQRQIKEPIHQFDNVVWLWDSVPLKVVQLRTSLRDNEITPYSAVFRVMYRKKIQVKTYLTDRSLTGSHKTNREKRWETHPASVQFALRRDCLGIEYALVNQLCHFAGSPTNLRQALEDTNLLTPIDMPFRCPVTMQPLSFDDFLQEIKIPKHGKANFQVGHMNPLKAINDDPKSGHTAQNISWISSDGNRIQGHLSLQATRRMIV